MKTILGWGCMALALVVVFGSRQLGALPGMPAWMTPWGWYALALVLLIVGRFLRAAGRRAAEPPAG